MNITKLELGKADWIYSEDLGGQIPCCSVKLNILGIKADPDNDLIVGRCGNGPLEGDAILTGDCGNHDR